MTMKGIKLITFDATNTLLKFRYPPWQYYNIVAQNHGYKGNEEQVKIRLQDSVNLMSRKYPNFGKDDIYWEKWWRQVVRLTFEGQLPSTADIDGIATQLIHDYCTTKCWCIAPGGEKILNLIRQQGITTGVISNFDPRLNTILENFGLAHYFEFILTSYDAGFCKPDEKIFKKATNMCIPAVEPYEALHIGDDLDKDYRGAKAAGWHSLLITGKTGKPPACKHVFINLDEVSVAIEQKKLKLISS